MSVDLLSWPEVQAADEAVASARAARSAAWRALRLAPKGQRVSRATAFRQATDALLAAEVAAVRARSESGR